MAFCSEIVKMVRHHSVQRNGSGTSWDIQSTLQKWTHTFLQTGQTVSLSGSLLVGGFAFGIASRLDALVTITPTRFFFCAFAGDAAGDWSESELEGKRLSSVGEGKVPSIDFLFVLSCWVLEGGLPCGCVHSACVCWMFVWGVVCGVSGGSVVVGSCSGVSLGLVVGSCCGVSGCVLGDLCCGVSCCACVLLFLKACFPVVSCSGLP